MYELYEIDINGENIIGSYETLEEAEQSKISWEQLESLYRKDRAACQVCFWGCEGEDTNEDCTTKNIIDGHCINFPRFNFDKEYKIIKANS